LKFLGFRNIIKRSKNLFESQQLCSKVNKNADFFFIVFKQNFVKTTKLVNFNKSATGECEFLSVPFPFSNKIGDCRSIQNSTNLLEINKTEMFLLIFKQICLKSPTFMEILKTKVLAKMQSCKFLVSQFFG
jgi:hypothetical protein